jgi:transposase
VLQAAAIEVRLANRAYLTLPAGDLDRLWQILHIVNQLLVGGDWSGRAADADLPPHVPIYSCTRAVDLQSFVGLCGLIEGALGRHATDGHLFLFVNKRQDRIKALSWEPCGLTIWYKRLELRTPALPKVAARQACVTIDVAQLAMLLAGVPLDHARRRKRMQHPGSA